MNPGATYTPDPRDAGFAVEKHVALDTVNVFDQTMEWATGPDLDQGFSQECLSFAAVGLLAAAPFSHTGINPDRLYAEMCAIDGRVHEPDDTGSNLHALLTVLQNRKLIESYLWLKTATEVWAYIAAHGPVGLVLPWFADMSLLRDDGTLDVPAKLVPANVEGGHCIFLPGVRNDEDSGMHRFRFANSIQPARGFINFGELDSLLRFPGSAAFAVTKVKYSAK